MKTSNIFWGIFFIALGALILLNNFSSIYFDWETLIKLWPVVLVIWGLSLFIKENRIVKGLVAGLLAALIALLVFSTFYFFVDVVHDEVDWNGNVIIESKVDTTNYAEPFNTGVKQSKLNFKSGAGHFGIKGTSSELFSAVATGEKNNYMIGMDTSGESADIYFTMKEKHFNFGRLKNIVDMKLNTDPVWDLDFDMGAAGVDLDLSPFKIEKVDVEMGAAKLKVKFGDKNENINFHIQAGVSSIRILIPETSGCEIKSNTFLSNRHYDGFNEISSGLYRTENFETAQNKIYLSFNTGVSSIKVDRYSSGWE